MGSHNEHRQFFDLNGDVTHYSGHSLVAMSPLEDSLSMLDMYGQE
jgi:hypothetical protein